MSERVSAQPDSGTAGGQWRTEPSHELAHARTLL